jgi:hypothetical protein
MLGYIEQGPDPYFQEVIETMIVEAEKLLTPQGGYLSRRIDQIDRKSGKVSMAGLNLKVGKIIAQQLENADSLLFFICTVGGKIEDRIRELFQAGLNLEAYIMDLAATVAVEGLADNICQHAREWAQRKNLKLTNRFSPGYCNWDVIEQFKLFSLFPETNCGVQLTSPAFMRPVKSVSGIIGIGTNVEFTDYGCERCGDENCLYRNLKDQSHNVI